MKRTSVVMLQICFVVLMADYSRHRKDGSVLERGRTCYTLRRDAGAWKIVSMLEVSEPHRGPGELPR